jgi:hypothetical protein
MPLNYPGSYNEGLMGLADTYSKLNWAANLFPRLAFADDLARIRKMVNPLAEWQTQMNSWLPKVNGLEGAFEASRYARSISEKMNSLSVMAQPFAKTELAALRNPLGDWAKLHQGLLDSSPLREWRQTQTQLTALSRQLTESLGGLQHLSSYARASNPALSPGLWSSRLLDWANEFDAVASELANSPDDELRHEPDAGVTAVLEPISARFESFEIATAGDVAALRAYLEELYATLVAAVGLVVSRLLRTGHTAGASLLLFAGTLGGFLTLVSVPSAIDWYIAKAENMLDPQHEPATKRDLKQLKADVIASIKQAAAEQHQLRTVARRLRVRSKPNDRATCLGTVEAGQQVVVLSSVGKRVYISYQDVDRLPMTGWVLKKYLVPADKQGK